MKNFLKTLLVVVLVLGSIAGTTYFFFSRIVPKTNYFNNMDSFVYEANNVEFKARLKQVADNSDVAENKTYRFNFLIEITDKLDASFLALHEYFILSDEYDLDSSKISRDYNLLVSSHTKTNSIMDEYLTKLKGDLNEVTGANDVYSAFAEYIVNYSYLLNNLNKQIDEFKLNKNADLKFSLIEIFANVCIESFSNINTSTDVYYLTDDANIKFINNCFVLTNSFVDLSATNKSNFSYLNNQFITAYNKCNKQEFAKHLSNNVSTVGSDVLPDYSRELVASVYFKALFGV